MKDALKILIAPDSFKDCLSALEVAQALAGGIQEECARAQLTLFPLADGGEGTAACLHHHLGGQWKTLQVHDPLQRTTEASYLVLEHDRTAVIELARASGLELLKVHERDPLRTSTFGTGELIRDALAEGVKKIILTIGGSATVDGGTGIASALGFRFYNRKGTELTPNGGNLSEIYRIDARDVLPGLLTAEIAVACDVSNILNGEEGAARVYGPQKGAGPEAVEKLEKGLLHLSGLLHEASGFNPDAYPGTGAAGGAALFLLAYGKARLEKGLPMIARLTGLGDAIRKHQVVITGEGRLDSQTNYGKVVAALAEMVRKGDSPRVFIGVAGITAGIPEVLKQQFGMDALYSTRKLASDELDSIANAGLHLHTIGRSIAETFCR